MRNVSPVKINEFRISAGSPTNSTNSFIELYNAGARSVDISNWTLTEHPTQQAIFSTVKIPAGTKLAAGGFYLLGLSNSGLAVPARAGDSDHPRQEHDRHVGRRYDQHRHRLQRGDPQDRKRRDGGQQPARRCGNRFPMVR